MREIGVLSYTIGIIFFACAIRVDVRWLQLLILIGGYAITSMLDYTHNKFIRSLFAIIEACKILEDMKKEQETVKTTLDEVEHEK